MEPRSEKLGARAGRVQRVVTRHPEETRQLGATLAQGLDPGTVLALRGPLGAGKTCFAQGCARGLGIREEEVISPTFVLVREHRGRLPLYHIDLYRLSAGPEIEFLGLEEYLDGSGVSVIEWSEKLPNLPPQRTIVVAIVPLGGEQREITLTFPKE